MKVLMMNRASTFTLMGGDTIQMLKTKEMLEFIGIEIDICTDLNCDMSKYDIVHIFNIMNAYESYIQFSNAKIQGKKVVVSTIYQSRKLLERYYIEGFFGHNKLEKWIALRPNLFNIFKNYKIFMKYPNFLISKYSKLQQLIIEGSECILPNSVEELQYIKQEVSDKYKSYNIVVNGVDDKYIEFKGEDREKIQGLKKEYIFYPGRIEPLKNQINVIKALQGSDIPIVFVGNKNLRHKKYIERFERLIESNENYIYLGQIDQEEMKYLYNHAKVTALCSWFETTGLVGLEGGVLGSNVVITNNGYTKEYFKELANYCNPGDIESITKALITAYNKDTNSKLRAHIINHYTWRHAAEETKIAYENVLN